MGTFVKIGCGAVFWDEASEGPAQLVLDHLAEITMSVLVRVNSRNAADFVALVMMAWAREIAERNIKAVANPGGIHPQARRCALHAALNEVNVNFDIVLVVGADLSPQADELRTQGVKDTSCDAAVPDRLASISAYLGVRPIADALALGGDIVLTGRGFDSAPALKPPMRAFGWQADDGDRLAAGSFAYQVIERGAQASGGIFKDGRGVAAGWNERLDS